MCRRGVCMRGRWALARRPWDAGITGRRLPVRANRACKGGTGTRDHCAGNVPATALPSRLGDPLDDSGNAGQGVPAATGGSASGGPLVGLRPQRLA